MSARLEKDISVKTHLHTSPIVVKMLHTLSVDIGSSGFICEKVHVDVSIIGMVYACILRGNLFPFVFADGVRFSSWTPLLTIRQKMREKLRGNIH